MTTIYGTVITGTSLYTYNTQETLNLFNFRSSYPIGFIRSGLSQNSVREIQTFLQTTRNNEIIELFNKVISTSTLSNITSITIEQLEQVYELIENIEKFIEQVVKEGDAFGITPSFFAKDVTIKVSVPQILARRIYFDLYNETRVIDPILLKDIYETHPSLKPFRGIDYSILEPTLSAQISI
jgi:hypothetical protein